MSAANRLQDEWLLSYAAGNLSHGRSLMVASHLAYHEDMKEIVANAEAIGGVLLDSIDTAAVSDSVLECHLSVILHLSNLLIPVHVFRSMDIYLDPNQYYLLV